MNVFDALYRAAKSMLIIGVLAAVGGFLLATFLYAALTL